MARIENSVSGMAVDIAMLQVKSGVWGLMGGALIVLIAVLVKWVERG